MDDQMMNSQPAAPQPVMPPSSMQATMPVMPPTARQSSHTVWYLVALLVVLAAAAVWYLYPQLVGAPAEVQQQAVVPAPTATVPATTDANADLSAELDQVSNDSGALDAAAAAAAADVQSL